MVALTRFQRLPVSAVHIATRAAWIVGLAIVSASCSRDTANETVSDVPLIATALGQPTAPAAADFAGAARCKECHVEQFSAWRASTHGTAGGTTTGTDRVPLIAPFDGKALRFRDATVIPGQHNGVFTFTVQRSGERDTALTVHAVIGGGHMVGGGTQGFVTAYGDGTLRFLPFDWSRENRTWFCNTGTRAGNGWQPITARLRLADCGDWPPSRILGDEPRFGNCQGCHGSQIDVAFDTTAKRWSTQANGFAINCESCHGPAARHVTLMRAGTAPSADIGLVALATLSKDHAVNVCLSCHALKDRLVSHWQPGADPSHFYATRLSQLGDRPLTPDGRTRTFAYQEGHLASDCYRNGSMTCTSCHDPHSQHYRTVDGTPLPGRTDDRQCTSCHASKAADISAHTKHRAGSPGSACTACHMSYQQQPELGHAIRYARSDHSISIPRPLLDSALGFTSACRTCHLAVSEAQHNRQVTQWWGELKPHETAVASVLAARGVTNADSATALLLRPDSRNATAQVVGLAQWLEQFAQPDMTNPPRLLDERLRALSRIPDPDVSALALATLHYARGSDADIKRFLRQQLADNARTDGTPLRQADQDALRRRWALVLGGVGDAARASRNPPQAVAAYRKALAVTPSEPALLVNLGLALADAGDLAAAEQAYRLALRVNPQQPIALVNLGIAVERGGDIAGAADAFKRAIAIDSSSALGYLNLGTSALRDGRSAESVSWFEQALGRDAGLALGHFQLALALLKEGQLPRAAASVRRSLALDPTNAEAVKLDAALREALASPGAGRP